MLVMAECARPNSTAARADRRLRVVPGEDDSMFARAIVVAAVLFAASQAAVANDWIFDYGPYTGHHGHRVDQYKKNKKAVKIPYSKYFSNDGPSPYIPYWYYQDELGPLNGWFGGGAVYGGFGNGVVPYAGSAFGGFPIP
jgi:hypothetical protein